MVIDEIRQAPSWSKFSRTKRGMKRVLICHKIETMEDSEEWGKRRETLLQWRPCPYNKVYFLNNSIRLYRMISAHLTNTLKTPWRWPREEYLLITETPQRDDLKRWLKNKKFHLGTDYLQPLPRLYPRNKEGQGGTQPRTRVKREPLQRRGNTKILFIS